MSIKYLITRLQILTLSPIFPSLLTFILFMIYKIYFDPLILCDNGCSPLLLEQLVKNLNVELYKSTFISNDIVDLMKNLEEVKKSSEVNLIQREYIERKLISLEEMLMKSLSKSKEIEASIRKINPCFTSGNETVTANMLRALQENSRR